jgi:hypothetical protein
VQQLESIEPEIPFNGMRNDINDIDTASVEESYVDKKNTFAVVSHYSAKEQKKMQETYQRGAGAILYSSLVYQGWRFPPFLLTDSDERYLFDLEVKIKLNHYSCVGLLWEVLVDFSPHTILARPGLLQGLLDVLGSKVSGDNDDDYVMIMII